MSLQMFSNFVFDQLQEAIQADRMTRTADDLYKLSRKSGYAQGFAAGIEQAANEIVEEWRRLRPLQIAERIRKLKP